MVIFLVLIKWLVAFQINARLLIYSFSLFDVTPLHGETYTPYHKVTFPVSNISLYSHKVFIVINLNDLFNQ